LAYLTCGGTATCTNPPYGLHGCNWNDVGELVTHESGHLLGLDHTCVGSYPPPYNACPGGTYGTVMAPTFQPGSTARRVLSQDDVAGVCTIYPAGAPTAAGSPASGVVPVTPSGAQSCSAPAPKPPASTGGCNCSSVGDGFTALAGVVLAAATLRRRRRKAI
jgi:MYXO-CTERM domain-containing protein